MPTLELPALYIDNVVTEIAVARPLVINRDPGPGETDVPLQSTIAVEIVDPGPDGVDRMATRIWVDDKLAYDGATGLAAGFGGPRAEVSADGDTLRVVLDPATPFASQSIIEVRIASAIEGGLEPLEIRYTFTAEDLTAPRVVSAQALSQRSVRVGFDEAIQVIDLSGAVFEALDGPAVPIHAVAAQANGTLLDLTLDTEMTPGVRYQVVISGAADMNGNPVQPPNDRIVFIGFQPPRPAIRRFDLWSMLPRHNRRDDTTGDLRRFMACLQEVLELILAEIDRFSDIFDIERAPSPFLDLILHDLGNPFPFDLDELAKRRLASVLVEMYRLKGTATGIQNAIRFFLGIEITAITLFAGTALVLGESELGVDWELGPSDRFARYAFHVEVNVALSDTQRRQIRMIVDYLKPAHTHFVDLIEPGPPPTFDHWELGVSELGTTTDLHG